VSKTSRRRPAQVSEAQFAENYDRIFGKQTDAEAAEWFRTRYHVPIVELTPEEVKQRYG
jgi:hypothetical protein